MTLISIRRPKLALCALRSYRAPKYPKAGEELDFDLADVSRWPFAPALASALLASTLVVTSTTANAGTSTPKTGTAIESKLVPNPFGPEQRKLDFGGKGGPMTIPKEMALVAIEKGFKESGIHFQSQVRFTADGIRAEIDGYDPKKKIGFEWIEPWGGEEELTLSRKEAAQLDEEAKAGKRQIAVIYSTDQRFADRRFDSGQEAKAAARLTQAVQQYVDYLRSVGAL